MTITSKGLLITFLGVFIMSLESLFIKLAQVPALTFSFYIGVLMFVSMSATFIYKKKSLSPNINRGLFFPLVIGALLGAVANIFFISAIKTTAVANVVLIISTSALFSSFFAFLFYKEKISKNILVSSFFIFIGLSIIFGGSLEIGGFVGNIYALLCTISFSISFVLLSKYKNIDRVIFTGFVGLLLAFISFFLLEDIKIDTEAFVFVALMGLLITPFSRVLISNGTKFISASEVSLLMIVETIMAPIWVWLFLNEIPSQNTFIGGAIILLTIILNSIYKIKSQKQAR